MPNRTRWMYCVKVRRSLNFPPILLRLRVEDPLGELEAKQTW